ncbi:MAG: tetratricopeptide repeat protein, partial [Bacteroidia bacterium]|nr:tetratricopeptide repeat protein [Bacteroidia bacterium]
MKFPFLTLFLSCFLAFTSLFGNQPDSLINLLETPLEDTTRIDILDKLCKAYVGEDPDKAISYAEDAVVLAEKIGDGERLGYAYKNIGLGQYYKSDFVNVLDAWQKSLEVFQNINHDKGTANLLNNIGAVYYSRGDNTKAVEYYLEAIRIAERSGDDMRAATVLQNIGAIYESTKEYDKAESYLVQANEIFKSIEYDKGEGMTSLNLGEIYFEQGDLELSRYYLTTSMEIFDTIPDGFLTETMNLLGRLNTREGKYDKAYQYLSDAYKMANEKDNKLSMLGSRNCLGELYLARQEGRKAVKAYEEGKTIANQIGANEDLRDSYLGLTAAYKFIGDFKNTARYQDSLINITKVLFDSEKTKVMEGLQLSFDVEKKETEIIRLNADNKIKSEQLARGKLVRNFLIGMAVLLLVLVGGIADRYRYIHRTNKIITEEKDKSNKLLLNILPEETAEELKHNGAVKARKYKSASVLFTDFVDFTGTAKNMPPEDLVENINYYFTAFDAIVKKHKLEKIKTIGDAYMCAGGIPHENDTHIKDTVYAALDIIDFVKDTYDNPPEGLTPFKIRIGINSGRLVAGVVGSTKFQYDIWGDTVNAAARLETSSSANQV